MSSFHACLIWLKTQYESWLLTVQLYFLRQGRFCWHYRSFCCVRLPIPTCAQASKSQAKLSVVWQQVSPKSPSKFIGISWVRVRQSPWDIYSSGGFVIISKIDEHLKSLWASATRPILSWFIKLEVLQQVWVTSWVSTLLCEMAKAVKDGDWGAQKFWRTRNLSAFSRRCYRYPMKGWGLGCVISHALNTRNIAKYSSYLSDSGKATYSAWESR